MERATHDVGVVEELTNEGALWVWGRLREFKTRKILDRNPPDLLPGMTSVMRSPGTGPPRRCREPQQPSDALPGRPSNSPHRSGQHLLHDSTGNVGESEVAAHMAISELGVVEAQAVEHGGVQIVDVNRVFDDVQA